MIPDQGRLHVTHARIDELEAYIGECKRELSGDALALALAGTDDPLRGLKAEAGGFEAYERGSQARSGEAGAGRGA